MMARKEQLQLLRAQIDTAGYDVSVGEWIVLCKNNEIDIHPELQKYNCWNNREKTRFIEWLLLGIPIFYLKQANLSAKIIMEMAYRFLAPKCYIIHT
jgi:hypothetical protein